MSEYQLVVFLADVIADWMHPHIICLLRNVCQCVGHHEMPYSMNSHCLARAQPSLEGFLISVFSSAYFFTTFLTGIQMPIQQNIYSHAS